MNISSICIQLYNNLFNEDVTIITLGENIVQYDGNSWIVNGSPV